MKQIECEQCNHQISYVDSVPKFCSECGASLTGSFTSSRADETVARSGGSSSLEDITMPPDQTGPVTKAHVEKFKLESVGPYRLVKKLGQGGMGTVFEAQHVDTGRSVALKLLSPEVHGTEEMVQRFRRESQIAASINHPRSTFVYEAGEHEGQLFISMELMSGGTLKEVVADEGPLPVGRAVDYILDIIDGLTAAHGAGIVHRDLKPSNSFIDTEGRIKVGDFGLAKSFLGDSSLTATGTFMGTPQYAAPEQIRNADVDERTDIYALGGMLFYLLTGRAPFTGNPAQVISSIASDIPPSVRDIESGIPRPLAKLIAQSLEKDATKRPQNLNILRDGLLPYSTRGAIAADPGSRMAAFFIDIFVASMLAQLPSMIAVMTIMVGTVAFGWNVDPNRISVLVVIPTLIFYFALAEHFWGRTLGKWWMGIRVIDKNLELPSLWSALIRASLIPGLTSICSTTATLFLLSRFNAAQITDAMALISLTQAVGFVFWIPLLLILSPSRRSNGFQGLHGLLSGTKVVRISGDLNSRRLKHSAVTTPVAVEQESIEAYEINGIFHHKLEPGNAYLVTDQELNRNLWVFEGRSEQAISSERRELLRPSRLRIIQEGRRDDKHWYATESVPGMPLTDALQTVNCDWHSFYPLLRDLAVELKTSAENDLLPEKLSLDLCWLDQNGHIRILDHPVVPSYETMYQKGDNEVAVNNPAQIILELLDRYMAIHDYPSGIIRFQQELSERVDDSEVFDWVIESMNQMSEKKVSWSTLDRIGMLAITLGFEFYFLNALLFATSYLIVRMNLSPAIQTGISFSLGLSLAFLFGYLFDGGKAIRMFNVSVRESRTLAEASKIRCGIRNLVAWIPWVSLISMALFVMYRQHVMDPTVLNIQIEDGDPLSILVFLALIPLFLIVCGILLALYTPKRGIPDWIAGTLLMRK
ncbi:MAG: protein kinase [Planctomycetota bacterium]